MTTAGSVPDKALPNTGREWLPAGTKLPTRRQIQVLELLIENHRRPEIADKRGLARSTVSAYAQQAAYTLGVTTISPATAMACAYYNIVDLPGDRVAIPRQALASAVQALTKLSNGGLPDHQARELANNPLDVLTRHNPPPDRR